MKRTVLVAVLVLPLLMGCGSLRGAGPLYEPLSQTCSGVPCISESSNTAFARQKLGAYRGHFQALADSRAESDLRAGNLGIFGAVLGIAAAAAQSREALAAAALVGVTPTLFAHRYNLRGQPQIYERGARNFRCMSDTVRDLQRFEALYARVPDADRTVELRAGYQELLPALKEIDQQIDVVVDRTREDLRRGVGELNAAAIATAFDQYGRDLVNARDQLRGVPLISAPAHAGAPPPLNTDEQIELRGYLARLRVVRGELQRCVSL
ncbi:hypothetical protein [Methylibium rhizosphaerae]|uniref:hypothetical protein n=1 Tax=Methylibium rhizosphaerae TaxID=2570323 RepID=UPI001127EF31|nr:hypothetical protein [Methylibium rhizosphaerae]